MFDVVIPAFNAAGTVTDAITSAKRAGAAAVIVIDDGSIDETATIAAEAGAIVLTQSNSGAARARQRGAEQSTAEFVIFLDSDDELLPDGVHESLRILSENNKLSAAGGGVRGVMPRGKVRTVPRTYRNRVTSSNLLARGYGAWPPGAAVIRRQAFFTSLQIPARRLSTKYAEDYEMFVRLSIVGDLFAHQTPSLLYRMYDGKSSNSDTLPLQDKEVIRAHYAHYLGVRYAEVSKGQLKSSILFRRARTKWAHGQYLGAAKAAIEGCFANPASTLRKLVRRVAGRRQ